jgi:hypothetical protein
MNTIIKTTSAEDRALQKTARFAGWAYFIIIITSVLSIAIGPYSLMVENDIAKTIDNIAANQFLFRAGIVYELLMYTGVILLSAALFRIIKDFGYGRALSALLLRFGEAIMGFLTVVGSIVSLYLINSDFEPGTIQGAVEVIFEIKDALMSALMIFIGLGSIIFFLLFNKSGYIPGWLSISGIVVFFFVFAESIILLLFPGKAWVLPGALAILFEIVVGLWLIIKGINTKY